MRMSSLALGRRRGTRSSSNHKRIGGGYNDKTIGFGFVLTFGGTITLGLVLLSQTLLLLESSHQSNNKKNHGNHDFKNNQRRRSMMASGTNDLARHRTPSRQHDDDFQQQILYLRRGETMGTSSLLKDRPGAFRISGLVHRTMGFLANKIQPPPVDPSSFNNSKNKDDHNDKNKHVYSSFPWNIIIEQQESENGNKYMSLYPYNLAPVPENIDFTSFKPKGGKRFIEYTTGSSPWRITPEMMIKSDEQARSRRRHVRNAMKFVWNNYETYAFGSDELLPQSRKGVSGWGNLGLTLVDSLDTLWLMDLKEEFWRARDWVRDELSHDASVWVSVFETTIRSLGGLLSAYDWSGDAVFLEKAKDLGERLMKSYSTKSGIPFGEVNLSSGRAKNIAWVGDSAITAEAGTQQIEFRYLAKLTNTPSFAARSENVFTVLREMSPPHGLYPYFVSNNKYSPSFNNNKLTFGAMSDSYYEYMLKIWIQGGKQEHVYREMYDKAMDGMHKQLLQVSTPSSLTYIADKDLQKYDHKMDHLVCFMGGLLALGAYTDPLGFSSDRAQRDMKTAKALTYTCYQMYARMKTGISAEYVQFVGGSDFLKGRKGAHYLLRPEAFESFYILHTITKDPVYREWAWECFQAIERYCKTPHGYGGLRNVDYTESPPDDKMESFFLAETLKYLYLIQDPDSELDILHKHVFNTEAHPTRIFPLIDLDDSS